MVETEPTNRTNDTNPHTRTMADATAVALLALLLILPVGAAVGTPVLHRTATVPAYTTVTYTSSVDGKSLSYYEWVPTGFNSSSTYPLAIYLHGMNHQGNEIAQFGGGLSAIAAAQRDGFLLISLNTRSQGFYVNSVYTGPQEQDVLDAIAVEEGRHHVNTSQVYLFGSSMGSVGTWSIAGHHPGLIAGLGAIAECPDMWAASYYHHLINDTGTFPTVIHGEPNQSVYGSRLTTYLSVARYAPMNFSGIRLYAAQGGNDARCPNNPHIFGYQQSNNTFLNSTCLVVSAWGQPVNCQTPFTNLSSLYPSSFGWRFVYEPTGTHSLNDLNGGDMFSFWMGKLGTGLVCSAKMGGTPTACP